MPNRGTIVLYALRTMAQACAALAALVGAVRLFRIGGLERGRYDRSKILRDPMPDPPTINGDLLSKARHLAAERPASKIPVHSKDYEQHDPSVERTITFFWLLAGTSPPFCFPSLRSSVSSS